MISDLSADTFVSAYDANEDVVRLITAWTVVFQNVNDIGLQFLWDQIKPEFKTANKNASVLPRPTAANAAPSGAR